MTFLTKEIAKCGSIPDEQPAIIEIVPVGATVVMVVFLIETPSSAKED
jgi:hypothetical protein